jgi:hypothetical protein
MQKLKKWNPTFSVKDYQPYHFVVYMVAAVMQFAAAIMCITIQAAAILSQSWQNK